MNSIPFGKREICYELIRSSRSKTLCIAVDQEKVTVKAPVTTELEKIETILHKKAPWILKQLADFEEMHTPTRLLDFVSGEKLPYLGRHYRLKVTYHNATPSLSFSHGRFLASLPEGTPSGEHRDLLLPLYIAWVQEKALTYTKRRIKRFTQKLQKEPSKLIVKEQEQRWGSCTKNGTIHLNWRIFLAPSSMVDYVIAHEVAHLEHLNHTKAYWDTLRMLLPDYEERKEWLRLNGSSLTI